MLVKEVEACSFDKFYSNFKKVTFRSVLIPIPPDVLAYLRSDGSLVKESHHIASILNSFFVCKVNIDYIFYFCSSDFTERM